jgi:hypothetical protein
MKKIAYFAPEMEVLNLRIASSILEASIIDNPGIHTDEPDPDLPIQTED